MGAFTATTNANTAVVLTVEMRIISPRRPAIQAPLFNVIRALAVNRGSGWVGCCAATVLVALVLVGCVGQSPRPFPAQPDRWLNIEAFELAVFEKDGTDSGFLHIYLDGDGRPVDPVRLTPSVDPTPGDALVLELTRVNPGQLADMTESEQNVLVQQVRAEFGGLVDSEYRSGLRTGADISVM